MSKKIPDFTDSQIWTVESPLRERFKYKEKYDEIEDGNISLLRVQAEHARDKQQQTENSN